MLHDAIPFPCNNDSTVFHYVTVCRAIMIVLFFMMPRVCRAIMIKKSIFAICLLDLIRPKLGLIRPSLIYIYKLALLCYNVKIAPRPRKREKMPPLGPHAALGPSGLRPSALRRHVALRAASFPLFLGQGCNFVPK